MNDPGILKELIEKVNQQASLIYTVIGFVLVNIAVGVINFLGQRSLKNLEVNVHKKNIRETKRLEIFHDLYKKIDHLGLIYGDSQLLQSELRDINSFTNENAIYLRDEELAISEECCNYFTKLIISIRHKDVAIEREYLDRLKREFNK